MTDPTVVLLWMQVVAELGAILERLFATGRRIIAGEHVTKEDVLANREDVKAAVARWDAAGQNKGEKDEQVS